VLKVLLYSTIHDWYGIWLNSVAEFPNWSAEMKNILIQIKDSSTDTELREFTESQGSHVYFARTSADSIAILNSRIIQQAGVSLKGLPDAAILKYISEYHPETEVVVLTSKEFDGLLSLFKEKHYLVIYEPFKLSDLKLHKPGYKNLA
jgi:hypothetical protein